MSVRIIASQRWNVFETQCNYKISNGWLIYWFAVSQELNHSLSVGYQETRAHPSRIIVTVILKELAVTNTLNERNGHKCHVTPAILSRDFDARQNRRCDMALRPNRHQRRHWQIELHCVSKNVPPLTCSNFDIHHLIVIIFGRSVTEKVRNHKRCFVFPPHLSSASALPCERGNPVGSTLVHCACNTVQLLQRSQLPFSWTMPPNSPSWTHWLQDIGSHAAAWVWVVSQKYWRNQAATGWSLAIHSEKRNFHVAPFCQVVQKHKVLEVVQ